MKKIIRRIILIISRNHAGTTPFYNTVFFSIGRQKFRLGISNFFIMNYLLY